MSRSDLLRAWASTSKFSRQAFAALLVSLALWGLPLLAPSPLLALQDLAQLERSAAEALKEGKALFERKKYRQAQEHFLRAYELQPNSAPGRDGLLLAADSFYVQGAFLEAEKVYRHYLSRYPTSEDAAYVQFQIARCLAERMERPDRDQVTTRQALAEYETLVRLYPTSEYAAQAGEAMEKVTNNLAEHQFVVGKYYLRSGQATSAVSRFKDVLETYPSYKETDKILFYLARAHEANEQPESAALTRERLKKEFPDSRFTRRLP